MTMTDTHTTALVLVPAFMLSHIKKILVSSGYGAAVRSEGGTDVIDMAGLSLVSDRDLFVLAGIDELSQNIIDAATRGNEVAFKAGFTAGFNTGFSEVGVGPDAAWSAWTPEEADKSLLSEAVEALADRVPA